MVESGEKGCKINNMLLGEYHSKVSPKGRLALPKKFREILGDDLIVTVGYESSLILVAKKDWLTLVEDTGNQPFIFDSARDTNRFLLGQASEVKLDEQGRFILPGHLRNHGEIGTEAVFLGLDKYVEIWDKNKWDEYRPKLNQNIDEIARQLGEINTKRGENS